ncbi:MAG: 50S ribosomal protein L25 [Acidimicrobiia bacterium]|nr:50S ribosomal protein L25 [Acidimicrobiia bacterium]
MDQTVVTATPGRELGTRPSRRLRAEGRLPCVVYGLGRDPITVSVGYAELREALKTSSGLNTIIQLDLEGAETETVIVRSVQRDPIKRVVTHADFLRVDPSIPIKVKVPINLVGEPTAVLDEGGLIEQSMFDIEVEVSPMNIPSVIDVDISAMTLDTRISIGDLNLPEGVTTSLAEEISVVSPVVSRAAKIGLGDELEDELAEGEEGLEGEDAEGEGEESDQASEGGDE